MPDSGTMPASDSQEPADDLLLQLALPRSQKVVLVIDLVESVRLMSADEAGTVARWHGFVQQRLFGGHLKGKYAPTVVPQSFLA